MSWWQDVRHGLRLWSRNPGFTVTVVATLALGIGANTAMFSILHEALLKPLPFKDPGRLALTSTTFGGDVNPVTSLPDYYDLREQASSFEALAAIKPWVQNAILTGGERPEFVPFMYVSADFFSTLGVAPAAGRWFTSEEGKSGAAYVVLVSEGFAQRRFGNARQAVGRQLALSNIAKSAVSATVVGVMPASFRFIEDADLWAPLRRGEDDGPATRQFHNWLLVGRLKSGVSLDGSQREADLISQRLRQEYPSSNYQMGFLVEPLQAGLFRSQSPNLVILMVAVGFVLLIACANVAGLLLARGALRGPELAIRAALGASRGRIVGQLLTECSMLAVISGLAGIALAIGLQRLLPIATGLAGAGVAPRGLEWPVLMFALAISGLTGLFFGLAPALRASSVHLTEELAHGGRTTRTRGGMRLRGALVVAQVAVSLILLVGAGLLIRSFARLATINPGFDPQHLLTGEMQLPTDAYPPERRSQFFAALRDDFAAIPGVTAVGFIDNLPIRNPSGNYPMWPADRPPADPSQQRIANLRWVLPGYLDALRISLLTGRDLAQSDRKDTPPVMVVSAGMAKALFPGRSPLGQLVTVVVGADKTVTFEVVGVAGDARIDALGDPAPMTMYIPYSQLPTRPRMRFAVRTSLAPEALANSIRKVVAARDPDLPLGNLLSMEQLIGDSLISQRVTATTLTLFATVAMLLAGIGLYGTLAYWVNQRMHEIGIRLALGAQRENILQLVLGHGMRLALIGTAIGLAASLALTRLMQKMIFGIGPYDPVTFATVVLVLTLIAAGACYIPARRAMSVDPMNTLRSE